MKGYFTTYQGRIILWGSLEDMVVPMWAWDSWEEVDKFIETLNQLRQSTKTIGDRGIPESILKEFEQ